MSCALRKHSYSGMSSCSQSLLFCLHWSVFKATRGLKNNPMHSPHTICGFTPKGCVMSCCFSAINKQCCVNLCTRADMLLIIVEWSSFPCWLLQLFHCTVVKEVFSLFNFIIFFICFSGLITTTSRKLDREQQAEHFLEVLNTSLSVP